MMYIRTHNGLFDKFSTLGDMKNVLSLLLVILVISAPATVNAQLYSKAYGYKKNPAVLFLHGGPGYNSFTFEASTAERLAGDGYYVVVFDQRGCGRTVSEGDDQYTFDEAVADVDGIMKKYGLKTATLLGHSWGGTLGLMYAEKYPGKVKELVLIDAPMDYQQTFTAIIANAREAYTAQGKESQLKYLDMLSTFDKTSLQYANYCFMQAFAAGLYQADSPAMNAKSIKEHVKQSPDIAQARNMTQEPVLGLYEHEHYTTLKLYDRLKALKKKVPVYAIYADDDGLFDATQLDEIKKVVGSDNFTLIHNASHSVFIDQQDQFLDVLESYMKH